MSAFTKALKNTTKTEWIVGLGGLAVFVFFYHFSNIPHFIIDPLFLFFTSGVFIYSIFFKKNPGSVKHRLFGAMFGGAFIYMFIESLSKLFAKWAVWRFFQ